MQCREMRSILLRCKHAPHLPYVHPVGSCSSLQQLFRAATSGNLAAADSERPLFTIEASIGAANPLDIELIATGAFRAKVHPDLPIATTWQGMCDSLLQVVLAAQCWIALRITQPDEKVTLSIGFCCHQHVFHLAGLYKQLSKRLQARKQAQEAAAAAQAVHNAAIVSELLLAEQAVAAGLKPVLHVATVGAQLRSMADISHTMCAAAGVTASGKSRQQTEHKPHADALLLVSGSHPFRQLPVLQQVVPGSVKMLQHASKLKHQGILPNHLPLWAVANPVIEKDASYTERKARSAGRCSQHGQAKQSISSLTTGPHIASIMLGCDTKAQHTMASSRCGCITLRCITLACVGAPNVR